MFAQWAVPVGSSDCKMSIEPQLNQYKEVLVCFAQRVHVNVTTLSGLCPSHQKQEHLASSFLVPFNRTPTNSQGDGVKATFSSEFRAHYGRCGQTALPLANILAAPDVPVKTG